MTTRHEIPIQQSNEILGGTPVFTGTRVPIRNLIDYLRAGQTIDEFLDDFPTVSRDQVLQVLTVAEEMLVIHGGANPDR